MIIVICVYWRISVLVTYQISNEHFSAKWEEPGNTEFTVLACLFAEVILVISPNGINDFTIFTDNITHKVHNDLIKIDINCEDMEQDTAGPPNEISGIDL